MGRDVHCREQGMTNLWISSIAGDVRFLISQEPGFILC